MSTVLRATMIEMIADADASKRWKTCWIEVAQQGAENTMPRWKACLPEFQMMCDAIMGDIHNPAGSGAATLAAISDVEAGRSAAEELGGNAWYTHITFEKVWFEGQHDQGEGGEVTLSQFKLAVQTYLRFLSDPERKPIEIEFPEF